MNTAPVIQLPPASYNRRTQVVVTMADGSSAVYSREVQYNSKQISPLAWWRKHGFSADERDVWGKRVKAPEYARLFALAGITPEQLPEDITDAKVGPLLKWMNPYMNAYNDFGGVDNPRLATFLVLVKSLGDSANTKNPMNVAKYVKRASESESFHNSNIELFSFLIGSDEWQEAVFSAPSWIDGEVTQMLIQLGAGTDAISVFGQTKSGAALQKRAILSMFHAGKFNASTECYKETLVLIEILAELFRAGQLNFEDVISMFMDDSIDNAKLHGLITLDKLTDLNRLRAIFIDNIPSSLAVGCL